MAKDIREKTALVINTHSRKARRFFFDALDHLETAGIEVSDLFPVNNTDKLPAAVDEAIARGNELVIIGGGDGTISALIGKFAYKPVTLGILPLGTANSFIRSLGIPDDIAGAVDVLANGKDETIDIGAVNGGHFANAISFGYAARVADATSTRLKRTWGIIAYVIQGLLQAASMRPFEVTVASEGTKRSFKTYQAIVANGSFYGPTPLAEEATLHNEQLVLITMEDMGRILLLRSWLASLGGKSLGSGTITLATGSMRITTDPPQAISVDGELREFFPLNLKVVPDSVKVRVPRA